MLKSRSMTMEDVAAAAKTEAEATAFPWTIKLFEDCIRAGHSCQIYFTDTVPFIGYTIVQKILDEIHILNICVAPTYQRQGYGKRIMESVVELAFQGEAVTVLLEVREGNRIAQSLYQETGFNEMAIRKGYYPAKTGREDAVLMALTLFRG